VVADRNRPQEGLLAVTITDDYPIGIANRFNGRIRGVTIEVK
jgi:hypothetical protein